MGCVKASQEFQYRITRVHVSIEKLAGFLRVDLLRLNTALFGHRFHLARDGVGVGKSPIQPIFPAHFLGSHN
jgi:hypothetical protein